jgi:PAS domain S-box-containing protein
MLMNILNLLDSQTDLPCEDIVSQTLEQGISVTSKRYAWLNNRQGRSIPIDYQISPIRNERAEITGSVLVFRDIGDRLKAEKALRQSESSYRLLFENSNDAIVIHDLDGRIIDVNQRTCEFLGHAYQQLLSMKMADLHPENELAVGMGALANLKEVGYIRFETQFLRSDGSLLDVEVSSRLFDPVKQTVQAVCRDISNRKQAELALQKNEERYRTLYKATPVMMYSIDRNLEIVDISDYCLKKLGYEREEMIGRKSVEFLTEESRRFAQEVGFAKFFKAGFCEDVPIQYICKDGKILDTLLSSIIERDETGQMIRTLTVLNDITDRKVAEAALRKSESKFRRLAEANVIGVIVGDVEGRVPYVNDYFLEMLGYSRAEFESAEIDWRSITPPEDFAKDAEAIKQIHEYGRSYSYEKEYIHKNGQRIPVLIGVTKLDGYEVNTGIGFVLDLGKRKRVERQLHDLNQQLEQKVSERTADLWKVNLRLLSEIAERKKAEKSLTAYLGKLRCFQETIFELSCAETLEQIYSIAIANLKNFLGTSRASIVLTNEHNQQLYYAAATGISEQYRQHISQIFSQDVSVFSESTTICNDVRKSMQMQVALPFLEEEGIGSLAWFPLKHQERLIGKLVIYYDRPNGFVDEDLNLANALATSLAVAISRKRTEIALREREQEYRSLVDNIPGAIYRFLPDRDSTTQFISDEIEKIVGYASTDFINNQVLRFIDIVHPEDLSWVLDQMNQAIDLRQPFELEYRLVDADNKIKWVYEKGQGCFDANNELAYIDGALFDISDRKTLESKQQLYAERLHNLYQTVFELSRAPDLEQLYMVALAGVRLTLKCDRLAILILSPTQQWQIVRVDGLSDQHSQLIENCLNNASAAACASDDELGIKIYTNIKTAPLPQPLRELSLAEGIASLGVAWIKSQDQVVGQVAFYYDQPHYFSEQEIKLVDTLATYIGIALTRKQAELALKNSEEKYRVLFNSIGDPVFVHGHNKSVPTEFVEVNDLACESLGYSREELYQMTVKDILPPESEYDPEAIARFLSDREAIFKVEHMHKNGNCFPVEVRARAFDLAGELIVVGIARDVSEHKRIEAELRRAYEQERELAELRSKFISMVSHEFRTPMSSILLSIDLLQHKSSNWADDKKQVRFERIRQGIKRIDNLIEDVLVMGKMNSGNMKFQPVAMDLIALCAGVVEEAQISSTKHRVAFKIAGLIASDLLNSQGNVAKPKQNNAATNLPTDYVYVKWLQKAYMDEKLLQHILTNLLFNAVKYSPQGGDVELNLTFQSQQVPIDVGDASENSDPSSAPFSKSSNRQVSDNDQANNQDTIDIDSGWIGSARPKPSQQLEVIGMVTISISDSGIGIEPDDLELLFDPFHRGKNVSNAPGTGLGLAIVKNAVDLHRGIISATSQVDVGTTFTVELPVYLPLPPST